MKTQTQTQTQNNPLQEAVLPQEACAKKALLQNSLLKAGERLDDLYRCGLKLIQQPRYFSMGIDPILLANFVKLLPKDRVVDLGTGNGAIPLLLWAKEPNAQFWGLELMPNTADLARRNMLYNGLESAITILEGNLTQAHLLLPKASFSLVVSNPPYAKAGSGKLSAIPEVAAAKAELYCTLEDVIQQGSRLLNSNGRLAIVHQPNRLAEAITLLAKHGLTAKRLQLVEAEAGREPNLFLLEAVKNGKWGLQILPTMILQKEGKYLPEIESIFRQNS